MSTLTLLLVPTGRTSFSWRNSQELGLEGHRRIADLIKQDGRVTSLNKEALLVGAGPRKSATDMAKKLAFEKGLRQRGAIDGDKRTIASVAVQVQCARAMSSLPVPDSP
jgi:hypothetical protein